MHAFALEFFSFFFAFVLCASLEYQMSVIGGKETTINYMEKKTIFFNPKEHNKKKIAIQRQLIFQFACFIELLGI